MQNPDVLKQKIQDSLAVKNLSQAQKHLKKLCKLEPNDFQAWYFLGSINGQLGKFDDAIKALQKALRIKSSSTEALSILGLALFSAGRHEEAVATYKKLIKLEPGNIDALINIGAAYIVLEDYQQAISQLQQSLKYELTSIAHANLGKAFHHIGNQDDAQKHLEIALSMESSSLDALMIMAEMKHEQRNYNEALNYYDNATKFHPNEEKTWNNKGLVLYDTRQTKEAIACFKQAIELNPKHLNSFLNLGIAEHSIGETSAAIKSFKHAIAVNPKYLSAYINLGIAEHDIGQSKEAEILLNKALKISPKNGKILNELGRIYLSRANHSKAMEYFKQSHQYSSAQATSKQVSISNFLYTMNYDPQYSQKDIYEAHKKWGNSFKKEIISNRSACNNKKIRIGYISPDFRTHSVAYFIEPLLTQHNKNEFEIVCYANVSSPDEKTKELMAYADKSRDIHLVDSNELYKIISDDKIDILIDLAGHTSGNSLLAFSRKPAAIQITYLGYPNTTGLTSIDYRIVDKITDPIEQNDWHAEQLLFMPDCFICYKPPTDAPNIKTLPSAENKTITFGCFNSIIKFTPAVVRTFSDILKSVSNSKLVLKGKSLNDNDIRQPLLSLFNEQGIDESRLQLLAQTSSNTEHLELYNTIDIALDTFPYNGTTTTAEALYMSTPVISSMGDRHASRVSASLLTAIGHSELIAESEKDYVKLATELANDALRLENYNENLRADMLKSPLCDAPTFTKNLENIYKDVWTDYCSKK
ncbi:MAG: tetratricopeptide repeat protein [Sulfuriflexus sp.]|nr:tetratricopeptide repeat protein [Sulfuriflexus sp.]